MVTSGFATKLASLLAGNRLGMLPRQVNLPLTTLAFYCI